MSLIIQYRIYKKSDSGSTQRKGGSIEFAQYDEDDFFKNSVKKAIIKRINEDNPGWNIISYGCTFSGDK